MNVHVPLPRTNEVPHSLFDNFSLFYARGAHREEKRIPSSQVCARLPHPQWVTPVPCQPPFSPPHFPSLRRSAKGPGVTSESAQHKQDRVCGAIRRHCCQPRLGAACELNAAGAIFKHKPYKVATECGKSFVDECFLVCLLGFICLTAFFHVTGHSCWHNYA